MRRRLTWVLVTLGIAALLRRLRRRRAAGKAVPAQPADGTDPATELRRKLDASRAAETPAPAPEPAEKVEERRADVHEHGRAALAEMQGTSEG